MKLSLISTKSRSSTADETNVNTDFRNTLQPGVLGKKAAKSGKAKTPYDGRFCFLRQDRH